MRQKGKEKKEKRRIGRQKGRVVTKKRGKGRKGKRRNEGRKGREGGIKTETLHVHIKYVLTDGPMFG